MKYFFQCPRCGADDKFVKPSEDSSDLGCALLFFGGILAALLYADHQRRRVQCGHCAHIFQKPSIPASPASKAFAWLLALIFLLGATAVVLLLYSESVSLPTSALIQFSEDFLTTHPRIAAYFLLSFLLIVVLFCWIAAIVFNVRFRRKFATHYRIAPGTMAETPYRKPSGTHSEEPPEGPEGGKPDS